MNSALYSACVLLESFNQCKYYRFSRCSLVYLDHLVTLRCLSFGFVLNQQTIEVAATEDVVNGKVTTTATLMTPLNPR